MLNEQTKADHLVNYLEIFTKRKLLIVLVTIVTAAAAGFIEQNREPKHTATATLIVDFTDPINTNNDRAMLPALLQEDYMATQIGIISSRYMAEKVMEDLDFERDPALKTIRDRFDERDLDPTALRSTLSRWMLNSLRVYVYNKSTRLIKIAFKSVSPKASIKLADTFSEKYLDTVLELNQAPIRSSAKWIEENTSPINSALDEAEDILSKRPSSKRIQGVYTMLGQAQNSLNILTSMLNESGVEGSYGRNNDYLDSINADILENEQLLIERSREYGKRHPEYLSVQEKLGLLRSRLLEAVGQQINSMRSTLTSLNQSLALRGSVRLTNVTLLNFSSVDIESDETGEKKAIAYGAVLGFLIGIILAFLSLHGSARKSARIENVSESINIE